LLHFLEQALLRVTLFPSLFHEPLRLIVASAVPPCTPFASGPFASGRSFRRAVLPLRLFLAWRRSFGAGLFGGLLFVLLANRLPLSSMCSLDDNRSWMATHVDYFPTVAVVLGIFVIVFPSGEVLCAPLLPIRRRRVTVGVLSWRSEMDFPACSIIITFFPPAAV